MSNSLSASSKRASGRGASISASRDRRDEGDLAAVARRIAPGGEGAIHRHPQALARPGQAMAGGGLGVQRGQVGGGGVDLLALTAGGLAQRCEVQQHHPGHQPTFPKSRLPPCLPSSLAGPRTMACDSALVMSYTVSAATVAPVRASISTPVRAVVRA